MRFLGTYAAMALLWGLAEDDLRRIIVGIGNLVLGGRAGVREVLVLDHSPGTTPGLHPGVDIVVLVRGMDWWEPNDRKRWTVAKSVVSFYQPYMSTCVLVCLVAATPLPLGRRLALGTVAAALLVGTMAVIVRIDIEYTAIVNGLFGAHPSDDWVDFIKLLRASLTEWPAGVYAFPILIWATLAAPSLRTPPL